MDLQFFFLSFFEPARSENQTLLKKKKKNSETSTAQTWQKHFEIRQGFWHYFYIAATSFYQVTCQRLLQSKNKINPKSSPPQAFRSKKDKHRSRKKNIGDPWERQRQRRRNRWWEKSKTGVSSGVMRGKRRREKMEGRESLTGLGGGRERK